MERESYPPRIDALWRELCRRYEAQYSPTPGGVSVEPAALNPDIKAMGHAST